MQAINATILNPVFFLVFFGTALASVRVLVFAASAWGPGAPGRMFGPALHLVGGFGLTAAVNVPLNNRLAAAAPGTDEGARFWSHEVSRWTTWNHARSVLCLAASVALIASM